MDTEKYIELTRRCCQKYGGIDAKGDYHGCESKTYNTLKWMTYPSYKKRLQERSHRSGVLELVDLGEE